MVEEKTKEISGHQVRVHQFPGQLANKMFVRFSQTMRGSEIIVSPEQWQDFCDKFLAYTFVDDKEIGNKIHFDEIFAGNISFLLSVIMYAAEVNFGADFLSEGGVSGDTKPHKMPNQQKKQSK